MPSGRRCWALVLCLTIAPPRLAQDLGPARPTRNDFLLNKAYIIEHAHTKNATKLNRAQLDENMMLTFRFLHAERSKPDYHPQRTQSGAPRGFWDEKHIHQVVMTKYRKDWRDNKGCLSHTCSHLAAIAHARAVKADASGVELTQPRYMNPCSAMCNANMQHPCTAVYTKELKQRIDYFPKPLEDVRVEVCLELRRRHCQNDLLCTPNGLSIADVIPSLIVPTAAPTVKPLSTAPSMTPTGLPTFWLFNKKINPDVAKWLADIPTSIPTAAPSRPGTNIDPTECFRDCCSAMLASSDNIDGAFEHPLRTCENKMGIGSLDQLHVMRLRPPASRFTVMLGGACATKTTQLKGKPTPLLSLPVGLSLPPGMDQRTHFPTNYPTTSPSHRGDLPFHDTPQKMALDDFCLCVERKLTGNILYGPMAAFQRSHVPTLAPTASPTTMAEGRTDAEHGLVGYLGKGVVQKIHRLDTAGALIRSN
jgi:hypothetical protein